MNWRAQHRPNGPTIAATLAVAASFLIGTDCAGAWRAEAGVDVPSYAMTEPASSNLNIDSVVLMCEAANDTNVLQLKIYLTDDGPLRPDGVTVERLKADPGAEISIDGRAFPVSILFADEFALLADGEHDGLPVLSNGLLDAMANGKQMLLHFDLVGEQPGQPAAFDAEAVIELGSPAIAAVRRCASTPAVPAHGMAFVGH